MAINDFPPRFDDTFLTWFRQRTEQAWSGGSPQRRWLPGLSEEEIASIEQTWHVQFPPDYRLFLRRLHAVGEVVAGAAQGRKQLMPMRKSAVVYNWLLDTKELRTAFAWPLEGLAFDLEHNDLWLPAWGERPQTADARRERLEQAVAAAPKLIPITGHRYLLGEPCQAGNPVLSVYQADIIIYGADLRHYLLVEFADLLGIAPHETMQQSRVASPWLGDIPFWGEFA